MKQWTLPLNPSLKPDPVEPYFGAKLIEAEPASKGLDEGYFVQHQDGHTSWSPKEVFEEAYRNVAAMPFALAFEALRKGLKVRRIGWGENTRHLTYVKGEPLYRFDRIDDCPPDASPYFWLPSMYDMFADDWVVHYEQGASDEI